jgi:membrane protein implicated in regulation of membrane protease activity
MLSWLEQGATAWLILALVLALAEVLAPGFFLIFVAGGAAITGAVLLMLPGQPLLVQVLIFAVATAAVMAVGHRWYRKTAPSEDPLLNDRAARLIGEVVEVTVPIASGVGRVRVGDGAWPARGPDAPVGAKMRVVSAASGELVVEPA